MFRNKTDRANGDFYEFDKMLMRRKLGVKLFVFFVMESFLVRLDSLSKIQ